MADFKGLFSIGVGVVLFGLATTMSTPTIAASYKQLQQKGFKTGTFTQNRAGLSGWYVSKGNMKYFCRHRLSIMIVNARQLVFIVSSGRLIKGDRKAYESRTKLDPSTPNYSDVKAGRISSNYVGRCKKV